MHNKTYMMTFFFLIWSIYIIEPIICCHCQSCIVSSFLPVRASDISEVDKVDILELKCRPEQMFDVNSIGMLVCERLNNETKLS